MPHRHADERPDPTDWSADQPDLSTLMDRVYRWERYIFDLTRRFYLASRDRLLDRVAPQPGEDILEIGVGTARNLLKLYAREPAAHYYGVDVSKLMLEIARKKVDARGVPVRLAQVPERLDSYGPVFGLAAFDRIFLSFSLTQSTYQVEVVRAALDSLAPAGRLFIIDFYDRKGWPAFLDRTLLTTELHYHVKFDPRPIELLQSTPGDVVFQPFYFRWAYLLEFSRAR